MDLREISAQVSRIDKDFIKNFPKRFQEFCNLLERNRIFMDRTIDVRLVLKELCCSSFTGAKPPCDRGRL